MTIPIKKCTKCGAEHPATREFFNKGQRRRPLRAACKQCESLYAKRYNSEPKNKERTHAVSQKWREENRERRNARERLYRERNPEAYREASRRYNEKNREARNTASCIYKRMNAERYRLNAINYREANPEKVRAAWVSWASRNKERIKANVARRRLALQASGETFTAAQLKKLFRLQSGRCHWCGEGLGDDYHADHRIAVSRGGGNGIGNIVLSCPSCNLRKWSKMPWDFNGRLL